MPAKFSPFAATFVIVFLGVSCGSGSVEGTSQSIFAIKRSADPRLLEARAALEAGRPLSAERLLANIGLSAGVEGPLCLARVQLARGEIVAALAAVEQARTLSAEDPRVFAAAAEVLILAGRSNDAEDEIERGTVFGPDSPDLERSRAFLELTRPGQGPTALARLRTALAADPSLPYCDWPLAQAHLLTGRAALGAGQVELAVNEARAALGLVHDLATAEELLGAAFASSRNFVESIAAFERALDMGLDVRVELARTHIRAAMAARLLSLPGVAEKHYAEARELGLPTEELSSGADFLVARARVAFAEAQAAVFRDDFAASEKAFALSLRLDPVGPLAVDARDGMAGARFRLEDYPEAALLWAEVQADERLAGTGALSFTHLNIARARVLSGDFIGARGVLREYLERYPEGAAVDQTRALLGQVPGE